ncbi:MAG: endonuclease/exonuclease/phosphatase family protein [Pseudolabrys sp.]|nr:endonuclease/exonuclease/phosphatase family protein [Pseudolabrys sp.]
MARGVNRSAGSRIAVWERHIVKPAGTVRLLTWNIHGAFGRNPGFDLDRIVALIKRWEPDVIALQEVDSRRKLAAGDPFAILQDALGKHGVSAHSIKTADGHYGQILISCCPIRSSEVHDISAPEREPRRAIRADIDTPSGALRIVATHLGLSTRERRGQARELLSMAGQTLATTVVMGDFNDWVFAGSVHAMLAQELPGRTKFRTFPSQCPLLRLDRIFCRPGRALLTSFRDPTARGISDHLPVIADVAT